jgi:serine phosphatase RsbU (regulator of sigma subunit)
MLSVKDILKKPDLSTTIRAKIREPDLDTISRENRLLAVINAVSQELLLSRPEHELIDKIMELINRVLPMDRGALMLMDGNPPQLLPRSICVNDERLMNKRFQVSQNILNMVMDKHSSLLISDVKDDSQLRKIDSVIIQRIKSAMCVPLWNNGEIMGVFYADRIYLRKPFSEEELELLTLIANVATVKIEDCRERARRRKAEELRKQLELAARIQKDFLPREKPEFDGFDMAGNNIPTYQVGGDYFDFIPLGSNQLGVAIADVSGKGPSAALHMVAFRTRLEVEAVPGYDIQEMTATLNDYVHRKTDPNRFISFFFCELDNLTGELKYVNAGHNPPIVIKKKGKTESLGSCGLCLGMFPSQKYEMGSVKLGPGDMAVLYTDGITECRNKDNKELGERQFINAIKKNAKCSAEELLKRIFEELALFTKGVDQMDDMTLVVIKKTA